MREMPREGSDKPAPVNPMSRGEARAIQVLCFALERPIRIIVKTGKKEEGRMKRPSCGWSRVEPVKGWTL